MLLQRIKLGETLIKLLPGRIADDTVKCHISLSGNEIRDCAAKITTGLY